MSDRLKRRIKQLKFLASMFKMAIEEFDKVMGPETIQTIFRLIGEHQGKEFQAKLKEKYKIDKWDLKMFAEKVQNEVLVPALGEDQSEINISGEKIEIKIKACPFKSAGIPISNKYFCTYTEGLVETIAQESLGEIIFTTEKLRSVDFCDCKFRINIQ